MDYKAFVSSTYIDLKDHRAHVIRELRKAGFFVDPMEEWTSAAHEPSQLKDNPNAPIHRLYVEPALLVTNDPVR